MGLVETEEREGREGDGWEGRGNGRWRMIEVREMRDVKKILYQWSEKKRMRMSEQRKLDTQYEKWQ